MQNQTGASEQCVTVPRHILQRLVEMADSKWQDIASGLDVGTYKPAQNPTHAADESLIGMATLLADGTVVISAPVVSHFDAKVVVVLKEGEVAQVLSDKPGVSIAVVEYGSQTEENLVLIPNGSGQVSKGWAGMCNADLMPERAFALHAVAESASLHGVVKEGAYSGAILSVATGVVTQKVDRQGNTVKHLADNLSQMLKAGAAADIRYTRGVGVVTGRPIDREQGR